MVEELVERENADRREKLSEEAREQIAIVKMNQWIESQSGHTGGLYPYVYGPAPVTPSDFVEDAETCGGGKETTVYPSEFLELVKKRRELVNQRDGLKIIIDDLKVNLNNCNYWLEINKNALKSIDITIDWSETLSVVNDLINVVSGAIAFIGSYGTLYGNLPEDLVSLVMSIDDMVDNEDRIKKRSDILKLEDTIRKIDDETLPRLNNMVSNIETLNSENIFAPTIRSLEKKLNRRYQSLWTQYKWENHREQDLTMNPA